MKKHVILCGMIALGVACAPMAMADEGATDTQFASFHQGFGHHHQGEGEIGRKAFVDIDSHQGRHRCGRRGVAERPRADQGRQRSGGHDCEEH